MAATPTLTKKLNSGHEMPSLGLGTFKSGPGEVGTAVKAALKAGYRLIDCAQGYGNQAEIGLAIEECFSDATVTREELFVVSKVFQTHHVWHGDVSRTEEMLAQTLQDLRLDYLDLLLIHWPFAFEQKKLDFPLRLEDGSPNPLLKVEVEYLDTWRVLEGFVRDGRVKSIGVSNFTVEQLDKLIKNSNIPPAVNQVEFHPYMAQTEMMTYCGGVNVAVMAYSPLGSSLEKYPSQHGCTLMNHQLVKDIADTVGKSASQVLIRWSLQRGAISIPKSANPGRIAQNFDVLSWTLTDDHMEQLNRLNCNFRYFVSYLKKPGNSLLWHDGVVEHQSVL
jgi:diketogulonate reductase-like aldo/keto reductase